MRTKIMYLYAKMVVVLLVFSARELLAQGASDLIFNEILVHNRSNYTDEYGARNSWIEIANASYNYVNIGGCYLTDDKKEPTKYWIPNDSPETILPPRGFALFYADDNPTRGIFHLNFMLKEGGTIYLYDANGRTMIDKLTIPASLQADMIYYRKYLDTNEWGISDKSTPGSNNDHSRKASAGEKFVKHDPYGVGMIIIAMTVVFSALTLLYLVYKMFGILFTKKTTVKKITGEKVEETEISGEVNAAIAMALYLYQEDQHDFENTVLTIKKVAKAYSPWSSKIYSLRNRPNF